MFYCCASVLLVAIIAGEPQPNVVVLLADDLGWSDLGCYDAAFHESPNLDALADAGMRFTTAYSAASLCSPTRASIMTGKHPARVNITDWIPGAGDKGRMLRTPRDIHNLPLSELTIGEAFAEAGYATYYAGKWHLGGPEYGPDKQGFQAYAKTATRATLENGKSNRTRIPIPAGERWHLTEFITRSTVEFIREQKDDRPFFAFVSYHDVHTPIQPDDRYLKHFKQKAKSLPPSNRPVVEGSGKTRMAQDNPKYASMVRALDQSVGDILLAIDEVGVADNTIVLFASDNGGLSTLKSPGPACNSPLRAGKGWLYDGGIRIPMMVRFPGRVNAGSQSDVAVLTTDFYPTLLSLANLPKRPKQHVDGLDFSKVLLGVGDIPDRDLFWHFPHYHGSCWTPGAAMRSGEWKFVTFYETEKSELYNLQSDPFEKKDLAKSHPNKLIEMRDKLLQWQREVGAKLPLRR